MRKPVPAHTPTVDISRAHVLDAYCRGLDDGQRGRVFEPKLRGLDEEREAYKEGFDRAREEPHLN